MSLTQALENFFVKATVVAQVKYYGLIADQHYEPSCDTQINVFCSYAECHLAECHCAACRGVFLELNISFKSL